MKGVERPSVGAAQGADLRRRQSDERTKVRGHAWRTSGDTLGLWVITLSQTRRTHARALSLSLSRSPVSSRELHTHETFEHTSALSKGMHSLDIATPFLSPPSLPSQTNETKTHATGARVRSAGT